MQSNTHCDMKSCFGHFRSLAILLWLFVILSTIAIASCADSGDTSDTDGDSDIATDCTEDIDCDAGLFCSPLGLCIDACNNSADCGDWFCVDHKCVECESDAVCIAKDSDSYCDTYYHTCKVGCDDCTDIQQCIEDHCQAPLTDGDFDTDTEATEQEAEAEEEVIADCPPTDDGKACEAGCTECRDNTISRTCNPDGSGFSNTYCNDGEFCLFSSGKCMSTVCIYGEKFCEDNSINECKEDGSGYDITKCEDYEICENNECKKLVCSMEHNTRLYTMEKNSPIAVADRFCSFALNLGTAALSEKPDRKTVANFDGEKSVMLLDSSAISYNTAFSVAVDIYLTNSDSTHETIIHKGNPAIFELAISQQKAVFTLSIDGQEKQIKSEALDRNRWYNIAGTFDGKYIKLYLDGELAGNEIDLQGSALQIDSSSAYVFIGAKVADSAASQYLSAYIDNLFLSGRTLGVGEISYLAESPIPCSGDSEVIDLLLCENLCTSNVVEVPANEQWANTDIAIKQNEAIWINPGSCVRPSTTGGCIDAGGVTIQSCQTCPLPSACRYSMIAKFGEAGDGLPVGSSGKYLSNTSDNLYFGFNDIEVAQNQGKYSVIVEQGFCPSRNCPDDMIAVASKKTCIDRYEASCPEASYNNSPCNTSTDTNPQSVPGIMPWVSILPASANVACMKVGKRLCNYSDWTTACGGEAKMSYPYDFIHEDATCNDYSFEVEFPFDELGILPGSYLAACTSTGGAFDFSGNVAEIVGLATSTQFRVMSAKGADQTETSTCFDFAPYESVSNKQGFRCCKDWQ